jgi:hypothetical protein
MIVLSKMGIEKGQKKAEAQKTYRTVKRPRPVTFMDPERPRPKTVMDHKKATAQNCNGSQKGRRKKRPTKKRPTKKKIS